MWAVTNHDTHGHEWHNAHTHAVAFCGKSTAGQIYLFGPNVAKDKKSGA